MAAAGDKAEMMATKRLFDDALPDIVTSAAQRWGAASGGTR